METTPEKQTTPPEPERPHGGDFSPSPGSGFYADEPLDANVQSVRRKMLIRAERGLSKYGVTTERTDLDALQWLQHAQDEAMDLAVYLERLMAGVRRQMDSPNGADDGQLPERKL